MPIPPDFERHTRSSPLTGPWEPIYARRTADRWRLGLIIRPEHTNSRGLLHGGLIAALADNAMGLSLGVVLESQGRAPSKGIVTTSLAVDYLGRATLEQWLEFDTNFVHAGGSSGVTQALITADGDIIARANAAFRFS